tara:strand:+ start:1199 stop:1612 length:414 start_codon:yes stop_codon:yes gene_type:complete
MPAGRPPKIKDIDAAIEKLNTMGYDGESDVEIAVNLGIARTSLQDYCDRSPKFSAALNEARARAQVWFEGMARKHMQGTIGSGGAVLTKIMQARFRKDYTEQKQLEVKAEVVVDDKARIDAAAALKQAMKAKQSDAN